LIFYDLIFIYASSLSTVSLPLLPAAKLMDVLDVFAHDLIKEWLLIDYIQTLNNNDRADALQACLIVYVLTATTIVPRQFLESV